MIITIDGPAVSGKTTIARMLAQRLGYYYLGSGILFRGLAYILVHQYGYSTDQLTKVKPEDINAIVDGQRFIYEYNNGLETFFFDGVNITQSLKQKEISMYASLIGTNVAVRHAFEVLQRALAKDKNVVAEGRDMGSIVFPHAPIKFFLTASLAVRATRLVNAYQESGKPLLFDEAQAIIKKRDMQDTSRQYAPLIIPTNAIVIDDSLLSKEEVIEHMLKEIHKFSMP